MKTLAITAIAVGAVAALGLACFGYCRLSFIDETVSSGAKYGFAIGMTRPLAYGVTREQFSEDQVYVLHPLDDRNHGPHGIAAEAAPVVATTVMVNAPGIVNFGINSTLRAGALYEASSHGPIPSIKENASERIDEAMDRIRRPQDPCSCPR